MSEPTRPEAAAAACPACKCPACRPILLGLLVGAVLWAVVFALFRWAHVKFTAFGPAITIVGAAGVVAILVMAAFRRRRGLRLLPAALALAVVPTLALVVHGGGGALADWLRSESLPAGLAPGGGEPVAPTPAEADALARLAARIDATLVWTSNRDGDMEIYLKRIGEPTIRQLTRNEKTADLHPVWFPDGRHIAFTRSPEPDPKYKVAASIMRMDTQTGAEEVLVADGQYPRLTDGGRTLLFMRGGEPCSQWSKDLATGAETELFPRDIAAFEKMDSFLAAASPDGRRLAVTKGTPVGSYDIVLADADGGNFVRVAEGCRPDWLADGSGVVFVARAQGIAAAAGPDFAWSLLIPKADGEILYYPKASNDPRYFTFARGPEVSKHRARGRDEVYLFDRQTGEQVRLTFHTNNDTFSDLFVASARPTTRQDR